jgi:hypothetical protein
MWLAQFVMGKTLNFFTKVVRRVIGKKKNIFV